ncbi:hypothetical protein Vretimale_3063 [Volvox reticuliferus]|uniref:Saposin B-type domain-containing protein n=3 Tax=Volvox reticuliferus TaxID=1737510 RepID=A0A8J4D7Y2_9CHLO|nr:hypothetical protein Vretimale_3063 [Volvox reticuliferus]
MVRLLYVLLFAFIAVASAQFGGPKRPKTKAPVNRDDIKYIKCKVCEAMAKEARNVVKELGELAGAKKINEADILERLEKMCNPDLNEGDWIAMYDIVKEGDILNLKDTGMVGRCKSKCRTIARTCELIAEDLDLTDLSAMLFKGKKRSAVTNWMCYDATDVCISKPPPVPADRPVGEPHEPLDEDEYRNIMMMRDMEAIGVSGSLYSRDTLTEELEEMQDMYGDDPDFAQVMKDTGMDSFASRKPDEEPTSGETAVDSSTMTKLQETAAKAAGDIKDGAAKLVEGAKKFMGKLFGGSKQDGKSGEL